MTKCLTTETELKALNKSDWLNIQDDLFSKQPVYVFHKIFP
jgi:hypothetical protein